ncbi:asparagine synthase (glutamine-hydrolyzing) [bacterium]|nr:asparagine synthase (glutamine-hydrolyzing) [bacterium]
MCGIAVLVSPSERIQAALIKNLIDVIAHRGPDDEGYVGLSSGVQARCWGGKATPAEAYTYPYPVPLTRQTPDASFQAVLGSRRLAITDRSVAGHQPHCNSKGSLWMVFNGEIYNHLELRVQLQLLGHDFRTQSDTETLLTAYAAWGAECLPRLIGQFAFVILDSQNQTYFAARDRFGIKPLYYSNWSSGLCFASEIKQFTRLPHWRAHLNHQTAFEFLRWGTLDHSSQTLFRNVQQLAGGHYLQGSWSSASQAPVQHRWYHLQTHRISTDYGQAVEEFRSLLEQSVLKRAHTDQPLGVSFSGGLDSVSIASILRSSSQLPTRTFSACSEDPRLNEKPLIDELVQERAGLQAHFCLPQREQFFQQIRELLWHQDEPFNGTSLFAEWCVFKLARNHGIRVSLEGHGADECLLGYANLLGPYAQESLRQGKLLRGCRNLIEAARSGFVSPTGLLGLLGRQFAPRALLEIYRRLKGAPTTAYPGWMNEWALWADPTLAEGLGRRKNNLQELQHSGLWEGGLAHQLHWADRSSMAHSIESRVPYLDHRLVEFCLSLPSEYLFRKGRTKAILRDSCRGITPSRVLDRVPKIGYATAEQTWIQQDSQTVWELCRKAVHNSQGIFNQATLTRCSHIIKGRKAYDSWIWRVISFGLWMEQFQVQVRESHSVGSRSTNWPRPTQETSNKDQR